MPGKSYRFTANVFPDIVKKYKGGKKVRPGDIWTAEARAGWSAPDTSWPRGQDPSGEQGVIWSDWFNKAHGTLEFGVYGEVEIIFTAPASGEVRVWLECKTKWGFENNWFMDDFSLILSDEEGEGEGEEGGEEKEEEAQLRGAPRLDYARTYVLLPEDLPREMALAAMRAVYATKKTVGFSADDAGVGDLDHRRVICVNPQDIGEGLTQDWYDEHYPGVEFVAVGSDDPDKLERKLRDKL
jgi:hypothetical protein